jgi:TM2 domain-containing membrane protein YozV
LSNAEHSASIRAAVAGLLAWLIPGLGHIYLGHRTRGLILLVTVTVTFWSGVAIGGVRSTVDPRERRLWFVAQICTGGNTMAAVMLRQRIERTLSPEELAGPGGHWLPADVGVHYTGVAGLLNLLVILDVVARADRNGSLRRHPQRVPAPFP